MEWFTESIERNSGVVYVQQLGIWVWVQVCFADSREQADGIYIIAKGWVEMSLSVKQGGSTLRVLKRGCALGYGWDNVWVRK